MRWTEVHPSRSTSQGRVREITTACTSGDTAPPRGWRGSAHLRVVITSTALHSLTTAFVTADVYPNLNGVGGAGKLKTVIGALMTIVLIVAVLMMIVCAATWAVASSHGSYSAAIKARTGLLVAVGAAALDGAAIAWLNFLLGIGPTL